MNNCNNVTSTQTVSQPASLKQHLSTNLKEHAETLSVIFNSGDAYITMVTCDIQAIRTAQSSILTEYVLLTFLVLTLFVLTKSYYNHVQRRQARCTVFVIGAGPTGLTAVLLASQNPHVSRVIVYEEMTRAALIARPHQVELNRKSREFLSCLGLNLDSLEGCMENNIFHTRIGVFLEHLLDLIKLTPVPVTFNFGLKFSRDKIVDIESCSGRKVVIASDGSSGQSARLLGLSDEFMHSSCHAYGAVASLERAEVGSVPLAERRVHSLVFDLSAYGIGFNNTDIASGFSLKMFGNTRHRCMSLAIPRSDSVLVKHMRLVLDRSMMRNIFIKCYNTCKWSSEDELSESLALRHLKFSPRLFDIKLFQRLETVVYFQDTDMFVMVEGEAARCCNFHTGLDVNVAIAGLSTSGSAITLAACALTDWDIVQVLLAKSQQSKSLAKQFLRSGLRQDMFAAC